METVAVIGGMGSGKSTVSRLLEARGARRIDLDELGHRVLSDPAVASRLAAEFGEAVLRDGAVDRPSLARAAFAAPEGAAALSRITHPAIAELACHELEEAARTGVRAAVVEASAYGGPGGALDPVLERCSAVIAVTAPVDVRVQRAVDRGFSREDVLARMANQPSDAQREAWADAVVRNDGTLDDLGLQAASVWERYFG